jgi:hypothetical protein
MICKIQVVTLGEDGHQQTCQIACLHRTDLKPETLGLTLAEGKNSRYKADDTLLAFLASL